MKVLGLTFGAAGGADLERLRLLAPSYDHVGSTLGPDPVDGVTRIEHTVHAGNGAESLAAVRDALRSWRPQRSFGMTITPADVRPDLGETVVLGLGVGPVRLQVPDRIVAVIEEPTRYGYAYGTLPGHGESGEELFLVELTPAEEVVVTIRTDSDPASHLSALTPVIKTMQKAALSRYLRTLSRAGLAANGR